MMYCTPEEVRQLLKSDLLTALIGDRYIEDPAERETLIQPILVSAIADAGAEIDGYLAVRHRLPLAQTPPAIGKCAKDIAVYNLISRIGVGGDRESNYRERYRASIKFLEGAAKGLVDIGLAPPVKRAAGGFRMNGSPRLFSRDRLRGM